jgi:spore coat polysaccharide biosynthesis protein SpsF
MRAVTLITARLGSSRLPRKMLADLAGAPVLEHVIANVRRARRPEEIVLATTEEREDDELAELAARLDVSTFRGSTNDVIARWLGAARSAEADLIVNVDGDDVLVDAEAIDRIVEHHAATGDEYVVCTGYPFGGAPTGIATEALARVCALKQEQNTEGQGRFFSDPSVVSRGELPAPPEVRHDGARMSLDYPEDLEFFAAVIAELGQAPRLADVVALLDRRPEIVEINAWRQEEYWRRFNEAYPSVQLGVR